MGLESRDPGIEQKSGNYNPGIDTTNKTFQEVREEIGNPGTCDAVL